jgi:hypothetical protein
MKKESLWGSHIEICYPEINYFYNKIENNEFFTFVKWNHGVWDLILRSIRCSQLELSPQIPNIITNDYLVSLSQAANYDDKSKEWHLDAHLFFECLKIMTNKKKPNFLTGISCKYSRFERHLRDGLPHPEPGISSQKDIIDKFTQYDNKPLIYGEIWKLYVQYKQFQLFLDNYKDRIVYIGPNHFKDDNDFVYTDTREDGGIKIKQIFIPYQTASKPNNIETICNKVFELYKPKTIFLISAGLLATYIADKIFHKFKEVFVIDIGQAMHTYRYQLSSSPLST